AAGPATTFLLPAGGERLEGVQLTQEAGIWWWPGGRNLVVAWAGTPRRRRAPVSSGALRRTGAGHAAGISNSPRNSGTVSSSPRISSSGRTYAPLMVSPVVSR